ncbi:MAG: Kef-type K+ transport system membrane component [Limisphaerales bacterium]|nr:MAG: Kef-type K+ transport system membrane component [Limisphaerales bacterium]KAG0509202.1 MAG: Kef-type K+ transport system membrane component [Limisphaerales bacterium]TXT52458.1 MAG: Kef-type K+ transport system membrane component [Limisphaerales bacterium]
MNTVEAVIFLILLFMAVPDVCRHFGRPALIYSAFTLFGVLLSPLVDAEVKQMLGEAGKVGFLLLLFEVGLEIELSKFRSLLPALRYTAGWVLAQYPLLLLVTTAIGLDLLESLLACAALTACSVGMAHSAWKHHPHLTLEGRELFLQVMVLLEVLAILVLSVESAAMKQGMTWLIGLQLLGIAAVIYGVSRLAVPLQRLFQTILTQATHWRIHLVVLLVLAVCAVGERLGLSAPKTAFFLGLFLARIEHDGQHLEHYVAPISQRMLIPVFFFALGLAVPWGVVFSWTGLLALGTAGLLMGWRRLQFRRWPLAGQAADTFFLLCPNFTIVSLAAQTMMQHGDKSDTPAWLLLTGLLVTVGSLFALPRVAQTPAQSP